MKLKVVGSGSSGNCYILENNNEALIIEAGVSFMEVKKALDFNIMKIVGVIVSHVHSDHSKYIKEYEKVGIKVYKPYECIEKNEIPGNFKIKAFELEHDAPCYGFWIYHPEMGKVVYASDTEYIKHKFSNINHFLVEANYDKSIVDLTAENKEHIFLGHMEIGTTCNFLKTNKSSELRNVILCHLSGINAEMTKFRERAEEVVECDVYVAQKGLEVNLSLNLF